jgi:hypothetical protein
MVIAALMVFAALLAAWLLAPAGRRQRAAVEEPATELLATELPALELTADAA